jgi:outer membrane protein OmpA-like peptidoglycan-associated protein/tetratricopeptide (TPR) repeat protein
MKNIYILSVLFCVTVAGAQNKLKKADKLFQTYSYVDAAALYEKYLQTNSQPSAQVIKNTADAYYFISDSRNALKWYQRLYDIQGQDLTDTYYLRYIQSLKGVTDYAKADQITREYLTKKGNQDHIEIYMEQKKRLDSLTQNPSLYTIKNLDSNTSKSDFGTTFYGDKVIFSSSRDTTGYSKGLYSWNKQPYLDLYAAERNSVDGTLFNIQPLTIVGNTKFHESSVALSKDFITIYFTISSLKKNKMLIDDSRTNNFQIVKGTFDETGKISKAENLFFNSVDYSTGHPALSNDGRELYFVSDKPGGFGGTDIYVIKIAEDGTMGSPHNLGATINTSGNEMFPFFNNNTLYFSSEGHYGLGGLDVFESKRNEENTFSTPQNVGTPINSNKDDFAYIINDTQSFGYVSSNRAQGKGDDDIYYFTKAKAEIRQHISGKVTNAKSKASLPEATITVYDAFEEVLGQGITDAEGNYKVTVPGNKKVKVVATKPKHSKGSKTLQLTQVNGLEFPNNNFELSNYEELIVKENGIEKVSVNPIFFEYNKSDITPQAATELDKVIFVMVKFPEVKIKIESHTDSRGGDAYNLKLSDSRAKSTQQYIISKGIDATRIDSAIGYGETQLRNQCSNGVKCTEQEHLSNRRSDFIIIQK